MADITSNIDKMNDVEISADAPLTQTVMDKIGANINALIDIAGTLQSQTFNSSTTWDCPEGVTTVVAIGCGGGGGGGGADYNGANGDSGGGYGALLGVKVCTVVPFTTYTITIGAGGAGASGASGAAGATGGSTSFGALATFLGGPGGVGGSFTGGGNTYAYSTSRNGGTKGGYGTTIRSLLYTAASSITVPELSGAGEGSAFYAGGAAGTYGGGGGAGPFGAGAAGVSTIPTAGNNASANTGAGGGGASCNGTADRGGGDGGSGKLILVWAGSPA